LQATRHRGKVNLVALSLGPARGYFSKIRFEKYLDPSMRRPLRACVRGNAHRPRTCDRFPTISVQRPVVRARAGCTDRGHLREDCCGRPKIKCETKVIKNLQLFLLNVATFRGVCASKQQPITGHHGGDMCSRCSRSKCRVVSQQHRSLPVTDVRVAEPSRSGCAQGGSCRRQRCDGVDPHAARHSGLKSAALRG
jgi:hypothetical protein